jgi:hypothetical protein
MGGIFGKTSKRRIKTSPTTIAWCGVPAISGFSLKSELYEGTKARSKPLLLDSAVSVVIKVLDKALVNKE